MEVDPAGAVVRWAVRASFARMRCHVALRFAVLLCWPLLVRDLRAQPGYGVVWHAVGKDTLPALRGRPLPTAFRDRTAGEAWLAGLLPALQAEGRLEASLDSVRYGSDAVEAWLHAGPAYRWGGFDIDSSSKAWLEAAGWGYLPRPGDRVDLPSLQRQMEQWLDRMDDSGHPFAAVGLDRVTTSPGILAGRLRVDPGPLYHIDSLVVSGGAAIRRRFLERYLGIAGGDIYRADRLEGVGRRLAELGFLRETAPSTLTMVGTGATLNLFLEGRKVSQVNVLAGLMPDNVQAGGRLLLTGEARADLRNAFGTGESLSADWQQIQYRSPRLRMAYRQPYVFGSAMGMDLQLDLLRKDSSYLNIQAGLGLEFLHTARRTGRIGYQHLSTRLLEVDTARVRALRALPDFNDAVNHLLALDYRYVGTDDPLRPRRGLEASLTLGAGVRRVRENPSVTALTKAGGGFDYGTLYDTLMRSRPVGRLRATLAHHVPAGRQSVLRLVVQGGAVLGRDVFRNELFQVGGLRLLRGFDEESLFASAFAVATAEYRLLTGGRSYFYAFADAGRVDCRAWRSDTRAWCAGVGLGLALETKAGMLNLAYAVGQRDGQGLDLRQSKIHVGLSGLF
jgi:outer membrane protein assembly factor BamA